MFSKCFLPAGFILFLACLLPGEEHLTLDQCISIAMERSPLIRSYAQQHRASESRVRQARAFPQPEMSLDYDLQPELFDFRQSGESYVGINQLIEFPGRRILRGKIARKEADGFRCEFDLVKLDLIFQVKKAFYGLLLAYENQRFIKENHELALDFLSKAREKYLSGDVAKMEVLRAKVEAARAENRIKVAANSIRLARARLNFVMAREKYQSIEIRGSLKKPFIDMDLNRLIEMAIQSRPEIKKAGLLLQKAKYQRKQAYLGYFPDFSLGIAQHRITGEPNTWDVSLSFEIPILFWQKINGEIAETQANIESVKSEKEYTELTVALEVESAYHNALSFRNQIELFEEEVLKEAQEVYQMSMFSYKEGKIGSIELIESRRTLIELKQLYAETLLNYRLALAELEKFVGSSLQGETHE